jgi:hypothetical protein
LGSRWSKGEGFVAGEDKATEGDADEVEDGAMDEDED